MLGSTVHIGERPAMLIAHIVAVLASRGNSSFSLLDSCWLSVVVAVLYRRFFRVARRGTVVDTVPYIMC